MNFKNKSFSWWYTILTPILVIIQMWRLALESIITKTYGFNEFWLMDGTIIFFIFALIATELETFNYDKLGDFDNPVVK